MRTALHILLTSFLLTPSIFVFSQEGEDAASASATGSAAAPSKGAPKAAQSNSKLRTLHIAVHKHGFNLEDLKTHGLDNLRTSYAEAGSTKFATHGKHLIKGISFADVDAHLDLLDQGISIDDAKEYGNLLRAGYALEDAKLHGDLLLSAVEGSSLEDALIFAEAITLTLSRYGNSYTRTEQFESALSLATSLLTDRSITNSIPDVISTSTLTSGHNLAFLRILSSYGAFGEGGESLASAVLGTNYSGYSNESSLSSLINTTSSSKDYLSFLSTLTGERTFKSEQWDPTENTLSSVLDIPLSNVQLTASANLTLGQSGSESSVDVSNQLSKATSTSDRKVLILGAAKDLQTAGNIRFTNNNSVEDHALVLGAADNVMIDGSDIEYTGSNLGIGAGDTTASSMFLVNTNIKTGGNLALGSLGTLNISTANFSVGLANSTSSDPDNVYLYANDLININNLGFSGRVDDIYMESKTIHIQNTSFPATADVMLRSQAGSLNIRENSASAVIGGGVNFYNVKHLGIGNQNLTRTQFQGVDGHINSTATLPNGTPFIKIRGQ